MSKSEETNVIFAFNTEVVEPSADEALRVEKMILKEKNRLNGEGQRPPGEVEGKVQEKVWNDLLPELQDCMDEGRGFQISSRPK